MKYFSIVLLLFLSTALQAKPYADLDTIEDMCLKQLVKSLTHPRSFKYEGRLGHELKGNDDTAMVIDYSALNGFGNRIPGRVGCLVTAAGVVSLVEL